MANPPKVVGPDGVSRVEFVFSTTLTSRFFSGTTDPDTVDMQVSIRGGAFTNEPDLIAFEGTSWTLPNSTAFPDGLDLQPGKNEIFVRSVSSSGAVSTPARIEVRVIRDGDLTLVAAPPTEIEVERLDNQVDIKVTDIDDPTLVGFNFYASQFAGGGITGYRRINIETVIDSSIVTEDADLAQIEQSVNIATNGFGDPAADPLFVKISQTQVGIDDTEVQEDFVERIEVPEFVTQVTTSLVVKQVRQFDQYSFRHDRAGGPNSTPATVSIGAFASIAATEPLYYVVSAIYYDSVNLVETESSFSIEVVGSPLTVSTNVGNFPVLSRQQIVKDYMASVFRSSPTVKMEAGSVLRDTVIDPFSNEAQRIRFIVDFMHRAQSFSSLNSLDDPQNTGNSVAVSLSVYKTGLKRAFGFGRDAETQALVDRAYEQLASNFHIFRTPGRFSRGEVTFFTTVLPTRSIPIPLGTLIASGSVQFRTTSASELPLNNIASFRDPTTGRFLVRIPVQAVNSGESGNVGVGQVRRIVSSIPGLSVTNESAMFGGTQTETNRQLAERAQNAVAGVDSGTARGYLQTVAAVPGVIQGNVVGALDPLMQRDWDAADKQHRGGKVDVWIQGNSIATVTDTFAFSFDVAKDIQFELISDPVDLEFRAVDNLLSEGNPIVQMLDSATAGFAFRNATTGEDFDLTGVLITGFNTIKLDTNLLQPAVSLTDVVLGDYRRRSTNRFVLPRQPVREITAVTGSVSGTLPAAAFLLFHPSSPLGQGRSSLAGDYVQITSVTNAATGVTVPSGESIPISNEPHVMIGEFAESLDNLGVNFLSIVVLNSDRSVTYRGPNDPSGVSDYTISQGDETTPTTIQRVAGTAISSGESVLVDYEHDENFVVQYTTNLVVSTAQDELNEMKHLTADVLAKDGVDVPVDIAATIVLNRGSVQSTVDTAVRTNLTNLFAAIRLGVPLRKSDIISAIDKTFGVSYVVTPLTKMVRQAGSQVVREVLVTGQQGDSTYLSALSTQTVSTWLIEDQLKAATDNNGGPPNEFRSVFEDDSTLELRALPISTVGLTTGLSFIIGSEGLVINGLTDDATLTAAGFDTAAEREAERQNLTANRILVTTDVSDSPTNRDYAATYISADETAAKNLSPSDAEYLVIGTLDFTYDEDR